MRPRALESSATDIHPLATTEVTKAYETIDRFSDRVKRGRIHMTSKRGTISEK